MNRGAVLSVAVVAVVGSVYYFRMPTVGDIPELPKKQISSAPVSLTPERIVGPDGKPSKMIHKDASGKSPYEIRHTPEGPVTIQRTFTTDGVLLSEQATLNGKPIPMPKE